MANTQFIIQTYEYKLRPNKKFVAACEQTLEDARQLYNAALQERISCYQVTGKSLGYAEQSRHLTAARELPEVKACLRAIQQNALEQLDEAFKAFFKRVTKGQAGFPRFKGKDRYHTFSQKIEKVRGCPLQADKLFVPGVGSCRLRLSRPLEGTVKQLRITRRATGWFALLVCEVAKPAPLPKTGQSVGVDVGVKAFATLSNGEAIANPKHLPQAADLLAKWQRRLSRKKKGSQNRKKARAKVARTHLHVANMRKDFHHKVSTDLVTRFDVIAVEALNIKGMIKNHHLSKAIMDVAWGSFFTMTKCKAEKAGRWFEKVSPRYTSQTCSSCNHRQKMPLQVRVFACAACGLVICRDVNAAHNILGRGAPDEKKPVEMRTSVSAKQEQVQLDRQKRASRRCKSQRLSSPDAENLLLQN